jgi:hypothetical protein
LYSSLFLSSFILFPSGSASPVSSSFLIRNSSFLISPAPSAQIPPSHRKKFRLGFRPAR